MIFNSILVAKPMLRVVYTAKKKSDVLLSYLTFQSCLGDFLQSFMQIEHHDIGWTISITTESRLLEDNILTFSIPVSKFKISRNCKSSSY